MRTPVRKTATFGKDVNRVDVHDLQAARTVKLCALQYLDDLDNGTITPSSLLTIPLGPEILPTLC